ncbi:MAG: MFS transporter [Planctomycetia bacterium]|nr:MFS transporter [Planctomycetia bacterium]
MSNDRSKRLLLVIAYIGFVSLGLPDAVIGVAWPSVRDFFELDQAALGLVLIGSGCGYFLSSFFTGRLLHGLGIGLLLTVSSGLVAAGLLGYSLTPFWFAFLGCAVLHGLGSGAIDGALNSYAAHQLSARHMNWLHACYCLGAMLGPLVMTGTLASGRSWRAGYAVLGTALWLLSALFLVTSRLWGQAGTADSHAGNGGMRAALKLPLVWLQMAVFFLYTGLEVTVGQWTFTLFTEARGASDEAAGLWVSVYWGSIGVGRVLFGLVVDRIGADPLLRGALLAALAGTLLLAFGPAWLPFAGLALIGLALAPVYPCLMTRTPQRLGVHAAHAVGFQVSAAMLGAAALPGTAGLFGERWGLETIAKFAVGLAAGLWLLHEVLLASSPATAAEARASCDRL